MGGNRLLVWFAGTWWMWDVFESLDGRFSMWRVRGCGLFMPVKVWPRGADWITLSFAKCSWLGATIDSPGGALFLRDMPGVLAAKAPDPSLSLSAGPSPFADCCCSRASMRCLCCSRTDMLLCTCSFMVGSWVMKPGDRQAKPTS